MRKALVGISLATLAASSCGGGVGELPPPEPRTATPGPAPALEPTPVPEPAPEPIAARPPPTPDDARATATADRRGIEQGFDARYPLHGVAFHVMAEVFERPEAGAEVLGYMRRGARLRATEGTHGPGCKRTWHELDGGGFVCRGHGFVLGREPQSFEPSPIDPAVHDALPYRYAKNVGKDVPQYWKVPSEEERTTARELLRLSREAEAELAAATGVDGEAADGTGADTDAATGRAGAQEVEEVEVNRDPDDNEGLPEYVRMGMQPGFYVSLDVPPTDLEGAEDYARTVRGALVEARQLQEVTAPPAPGVVLDGERALPIAFARAEARRLQRDAGSGQLRIVEPLARLGHAPLTATTATHDGKPYALAHDGHFVSMRNLRIARPTKRPQQVPRGARWIHVNLAEQTLVAYEGDRPVFTTIVSSGKEGYETPTGLYRIHTKHVSTTMDGLAGTDDVYSIEDVPWTMYFHGSYALHAAFWHDRFGRVRSHGCVNLAPGDARWLFHWTTPEVPEGWHGTRALGANPGTYVFIE